MERAPVLPLGALHIEQFRLGNRVAVQADHRVDEILIERDAREGLEHQLFRGHASFLHRVLHVDDARLDHVEADQPWGDSLRILGAEGDRGERDGHQEQHERSFHL